MKPAGHKFFIICIVVNMLTTASVVAQGKTDSSANQFRDELLDHLVGKWDITSFAHGSPFTATMEAEWVLHHQFLHVRFKGNEVVPWFGVPMEYEEFIGFNHKQNRYVVGGFSIEGSDDFEGFCYAAREGNGLKLLQKSNDGAKTVVQRMIWEPGSGSWIIQSRNESAGKKGKIFLDMKLVKQP